MRGKHWTVAALATAIGMASGALQAGAGFWSSTGPYGGVVYSLTSEPGDANRLYATTRAGLVTSSDGGATWARASNGLGDGRVATSNAVVDAERPQDVYALDAFGRLHRSTDRAANWAATGFDLDDAVIATKLVDIPGSTGGLFILVQDYFRTDGSEQVTLLKSTDNGASFVHVAGGLPAGGAALDLAFQPGTPATMLLVHAATPNDVPLPPTTPFPPTIYRSTDGGSTWVAEYMPSGTTEYLPYITNGSVSFGPAGSGRVYATSNEEVMQSNDNGDTWAAALPGERALHLLAHPTVADQLWLSDGYRVRFANAGTVTADDSGLTPNPTYTSALVGAEPVPLEITALHADPGYPVAGSHLWVASSGGGVYRRAVGAGSWASSHIGMAAVNVRALDVHPNPASVSGSERTLFAGFGDTFISSPALYRSNPAFFGLWDVFNSGLRASQIRGVVVDPTTARVGSAVGSAHVYAVGRATIQPSGYRNGGLYKSTNNGGVWTTIDAGLPTRSFGGQMAVDLGTVRSVALDPRSCPAAPGPGLPVCAELPPPSGGAPAISPLNRLYVAASGSFDTSAAPVFNFTHRLLRSDDAGASWIRLDANPGFPASRRFTTTNGAGETLSVRAEVTPIGIAVDPQTSGRLFVSTFAQVFCSNQTTGTDCSPADFAAHADVPAGVFRSTDFGANWTAVNTGLPRQTGATNTVQEALSLVMHPTDPDTLWVSMAELALASALRGPPIWKTTNGGASWVASSTGLPQGVDIRALAVDPADGNLLYAAGAGTAADPGAVYRSEDGGATWLSISVGLPADSALALAVDPHNPTIIHAGTNSGVWSMEQLPDADGDGAPDFVENNAPGGGDGNGDGDADATQGGVGSTVVILGPARAKGLDAWTAPKGAGGFLTTEVVSGVGTCAQAVDVQTRLASRFGRDYLPQRFDYYAYPRDLAQFEIMDCQSAVVDLIFHNADFAASYGWSMRFYGPSVPGDSTTMGWHDISDVATRVAPNRWRIALTANAFGSYRPVNDRILFIGGPACYDDRVFVSDFEAVSRAKPGCD